VSALVDLMTAQMRFMKPSRLLPVVYSRCLLTPVLADVERYGMQLDQKLIRIKYEELQNRLTDLETKMNVLTGGLNLGSRPTLATYLYETLGFDELKVKKGKEWLPKRTPGGARVTDADTIAALKATTPAQKTFLNLYFELNDTNQALSKYISKWNDCVVENAGLLQGSFNQMQTATQRLSSTGAKYKTQMQNLPREYKGLFCPTDEKDWVIGEADGAQLEFRVAAHLGRDTVAYESIRRGEDVHAFTAGVLTAAGQSTSRQDAKAHTFKPLYGGSSGTAAEQTYYRAFKDKYKGIAATQQAWIGAVLSTGFLETEWGLKYYWPDTKLERSGYVTNSTAICNYPVQAFATAEIIPLCLVAMWHSITALQLPIRLVNTVHDSIVAEIKKGYEDAFHSIAKWALTDFAYDVIERLYGVKLECQLGCGVKIGTHWGEGKEVKYESERCS
jgi:DNA polymerase I